MSIQKIEREEWPTEDCIGPFKGEQEYLSNFHPAEIQLGDHTFPTAEHAFQAFKANDQPEIHERIKNSSTPTKAKRKGKQPDLPENWYDIKTDVMFQVVFAKFAQNPDLRDRLLATGDEPLVEINTWGDTYWGVKKSDGSGKNHLGRILMRVRDILQTTTQ